MKVLVIGGGGRCHAIVDALSKSSKVSQIFAAPGNDGMRNLATLVAIKETDVTNMLAFAKENKIDLTVVGPEVALEAGMVDAFEAESLMIFGPRKNAAQIETSKNFAKELMKKYNIPTAEFKTFYDYDNALAYVKEKGLPIVLKYDGLAAGKGVVIATTLEEASDALTDMLINDKFGQSSVVIEDYLEGPEFSFMCFVDRENVYPMVISQDHKRAFDNDLGPNTGGMGAYSGVPIISDEDIEYSLEHIMKPTAKALCLEGAPFKGVLYGGLMKTKNGVKVIEFNSRFGDPETEIVLPRLKSDAFDVFYDIIKGNTPTLEWCPCYTLGIVLASKGYPNEYQKGYPIYGLDDVNALVYHMGTKFNNGNYETNGGRVLIVVGKGATLKEAQQNALKEVEKIKCDNLYYRRDIGFKSL